MEQIRLATRGSALARRQAASVREALENRRRSVELVEVQTRGDEIRDELISRLGRTGAFVRALDERVLSGDCDLAVHSMKDVPTEMPEELVVAGVPGRERAGDVLISPEGVTLSELPEGATVGTSSLRRGAQLLAGRPDLDIQPLRGNVDTRAKKLLAPALQREHQRRLEAAESEDGDDDGDAEDDEDAPEYDRTPEEWFDGLSELERRALGREVETEYDAIVLAEAGLTRIGLAPSLSYRRLPPAEFVPAPGQGALAVTAVDGDLSETVRELVDHPPVRVATTVERTVLGELGGGCVAPIGIHARVKGAVVNCVVRVLSRDGTEEVRATRDLPIDSHPWAAQSFAADLRDRGAAELIREARVREDEARAAKREE